MAIAMLSASVWGVGGGFFGGPTPGNGLLGVATVAKAYEEPDEPEEPEEPDPCANGHSFGEYVYDDDATCTHGGTKVATCLNCEEESRISDPDHPATGHNFVDYVLDPGSTCEHGTMTAVCETCEEATHTIPAEHIFQHPFSYENPNITATCTSPGQVVYACANCSYTETKVDPYAPALGHDTESQMVPATATSIGAKRSICKRCAEVLSADYFMLDNTFPTKDPDGNLLNDTAPSAVATVDVDDKTYTIILQDPLRTLVTGDSDVLGLEVALVEEPADFDGFADGAPDSGDTSQVESMSTFNIVPTVNGVKKSGKLNKKVRMLYLLNNDEDQKEMETVLLKKGVDTHFAEDLDTIGDDNYLVTWTDHFSTYAFIDRLTDADRAPENENSFPVVPVVVASSVLVAACVAGAFIYIRKKKKAA